MAEQIYDATYDGSQQCCFYDQPMSNETFIDSPSTETGLKKNTTKKSHFVDYGPIRIRVSNKPALTLSTGRRSKHITLEGEEAAKREQRREKNRIAARRLKEKRQTIEQELAEEIKYLEDEQNQLQTYLSRLQCRKQRLESELGTNMFEDPLDELLNVNEHTDAVLFHQFAESFHLLESSNSAPIDIQALLSD